MSLMLSRFGTVDLPQYVPVVGRSSKAQVGLVSTLNGFYSADGSNKARLSFPRLLPLNCLVRAADVTALRTALDAYHALCGDTAWLYATSADGPRKAWATLESFEYEHAYNNRIWQMVTFGWLLHSPWYGALHDAPWLIGDDGVLIGDGHLIGGDETHTLDSSPKVLTINNGGNQPATRIIITLEAGSADITGAVIACGDCELEFTGTLTAGDSFVIDGETWTFTNNGVAAFDEIERTANHAYNGWFVLERGDNTVTVTLTGGSTDSMIGFTFYEPWE